MLGNISAVQVLAPDCCSSRVIAVCEFAAQGPLITTTTRAMQRAVIVYPRRSSCPATHCRYCSITQNRELRRQIFRGAIERCERIRHSPTSRRA